MGKQVDMIQDSGEAAHTIWGLIMLGCVVGFFWLAWHLRWAEAQTLVLWMIYQQAVDIRHGVHSVLHK